MGEYHSITTLAAIRKAGPCHDGWTQLLTHLGKTKADDTQLPLLTVLNSNGLDDALWVLSNDPALERLARHYQAWCAEQVLHIYERDYPGDARVRDQIAMLRRDDATEDERAAAWAAARAAARAAGDAAGGAAWAAGAAARAARDAAGGAAWAAARDDQERQLRKMLEGV